MKLSIVISAYNEEKYLPLCLESIFTDLRTAKNASDVEVIVVNNGSTDKTGEIAAGFLGVKNVNEPAKGLVKARRAGYLASKGELIANIDADTKLPSGWVDKIFVEFKSNQKLVALSGPFIYYDLPKFRSLLVEIWYYFAKQIHIMTQFVFKNGAVLQGGNFIVRRDALEKIGGFDVSIAFWGEDSDIARRISNVGEVKFTFDFPMYASARRLNKEGIVVAGYKYLINYFWIIFFKKPFSEAYKDIRE